VANAVLAFWQDVDQEPADELCRSQRHGGVAACAFKAVILELEGDAVLIKADQATVGYRDPLSWFACKPLPGSGMRVTRQICQHGFRSGEGFFGVVSKTRPWQDDDPVYFAQWGEERCKIGCIGKARMFTEDVQFSRILEFGQTFQDEPSI
jgi:hypothetical protein